MAAYQQLDVCVAEFRDETLGKNIGTRLEKSRNEADEDAQYHDGSDLLSDNAYGKKEAACEIRRK